MKEIFATYTSGEVIFYKTRETDRSRGYVYRCECPDRCSLYKNSICLMMNSRIACPHGSEETVIGPIWRSKNFYKFRDDFKKEHESVYCCGLKKCIKIGEAVDVIFIPIITLGINKLYKWLSGRGYSSFADGVLMYSKDFTPEFIDKEILQFVPKTPFDDSEIKSYQETEVYTFMRMLKEFDRKLFDEVLSMNDEHKKKFTNISNIGRTARLVTLKPDIDIMVDDEHSTRQWHWDGEYLTTKEEVPDRYHYSFCGLTEIRMKPNPEGMFKITDDSQVCDKTEFID